jgi:hypothetical protein
MAVERDVPSGERDPSSLKKDPSLVEQDALKKVSPWSETNPHSCHTVISLKTVTVVLCVFGV